MSLFNHSYLITYKTVDYLSADGLVASRRSRQLDEKSSTAPNGSSKERSKQIIIMTHCIDLFDSPR